MELLQVSSCVLFDSICDSHNNQSMLCSLLEFSPRNSMPSSDHDTTVTKTKAKAEAQFSLITAHAGHCFRKLQLITWGAIRLTISEISTAHLLEDCLVFPLPVKTNKLLNIFKIYSVYEVQYISKNSNLWTPELDSAPYWRIYGFLIKIKLNHHYKRKISNKSSVNFTTLPRHPSDKCP